MSFRMKRASFERRRFRMASACAFVAALLVAYPSLPGARAAGAADAPPLIAFARHEGSAARPPLSVDAAVTLEAVRSDPAASGIRIGHSVPAAIAAAIEKRALSVVIPSTSGASGNAPDPVIAFTGVEVEHNDAGMVSFYAQDHATDSEVALVVQGQDVLGSIRHGDETYKVHPLGDGLTAVYRYDTSQLRRHPRSRGDFLLRNELMQRRAPQAPPRGAPGAQGSAADTGDVIDILVAYTPAARTAAGNIDAFIQFAIDNTHRIYRNSRIDLRLRLVDKHQVSYVQHPDMSVDLERLTFDSDDMLRGERPDPDGDMDEVHGLRDRLGADLVALIVGRNTERACGIAWIPDFGRYPDHDFERLGFSVTAWNCETSTYHTFAHELGHNQGADHDPDNTCDSAPCQIEPPPTFPWRHGRCNAAEGWSTTMSYQSNTLGDCLRKIEYFSSPILAYRGTPTGDAARRDNRRVLTETARRVASYRQSKISPTRTHSLPLVSPAGGEREGFVRIINHSDRAGTVTIHAIDDTGRRFGPVTLQARAKATPFFFSRHLERGGSGLSAGVGDGEGNWRLELESDLDIEPTAYTRTADGFLTSMHDVVRCDANRCAVPFFNPASNTDKVSWLRVIDTSGAGAEVVITARDEAGAPAPGGEVRFTLPGGAAKMLSARQLEAGDPAAFSGRLGDGYRKWQLTVTAGRPIQVMSLLLLTRTGHMANLSTSPSGSDTDTTGPVAGPDLVVLSPSVDDDSLNAGQSFQLSATVRNQGTAPSASTTLRYYRSSDKAISTSDTQVGTDSVSGLSASGASSESIRLTAPSSAGIYYYGACVDAVPGEPEIANNCSSAVRATVTAPSGTKASYCNSGDSRYGAIAPGWKGKYCEDGFGWGYAYNYPDRHSAISSAESECRSGGLRDCGWVVVFTRCGALAYGESSTHCGMRGGDGATRSAAEQDALSECRADFPDCRIPVGSSPDAGATPLAEAQSGRGITDAPLGASNPEARPEPNPPRRSDGQ